MSKKLMVTMLALSLALGIFLIPKSGACGDFDLWMLLSLQKTKGFVGPLSVPGNQTDAGSSYNGGNATDESKPFHDMEMIDGSYNPELGQTPDALVSYLYLKKGGDLWILDP